MSSRHQGLGGTPLGPDSPLFGGAAKPKEAGGGPDPVPPGVVPPWDPRSDPYVAEVDPEPSQQELAAAEAQLQDLRDLLPAAEDGRSLDDWGRSEAVVSLMDPLLNFYYRYWFRVETEGIENIPTGGGALLVSNHSGALPPDAPMIMQAIRNEHPSPRPLYMLGEHWFKGYPGVAMMVNKMGLVPAHRENAQRLLHDEGRLAIVFPEGQKGTRKLYWQRYRLRRFGRGGFVRTAIRAQVPIVPIALVGGRRGDADLRPPEALAEAVRPDLLPGHPDLPAVRARGGDALHAGQVQNPLPGTDRPERISTRNGFRPGRDPGDLRKDPGRHPDPARPDDRPAQVGLDGLTPPSWIDSRS